MLHCKFSGDYNSERIFKIGQYLTKLCAEHLGFTFFGPPCVYGAPVNHGGGILISNAYKFSRVACRLIGPTRNAVKLPVTTQKKCGVNLGKSVVCTTKAPRECKPQPSRHLNFNRVTIRFAICHFHFLFVVHWNRASISNRFEILEIFLIHKE